MTVRGRRMEKKRENLQNDEKKEKTKRQYDALNCSRRLVALTSTFFESTGVPKSDACSCCNGGGGGKFGAGTSTDPSKSSSSSSSSPSSSSSSSAAVVDSRPVVETEPWSVSMLLCAEQREPPRTWSLERSTGSPFPVAPPEVTLLLLLLLLLLFCGGLRREGGCGGGKDDGIVCIEECPAKWQSKHFPAGLPKSESAEL